MNTKHNPNCPCTWQGCFRHGKCDECKKYHHSFGEKTFCEKKGMNK